MHEDLALVVDQEGITHTVEVQRVDDFSQTVQGQVATDHADVARGSDHYRNHHFAGAGVNVGFGQDRAVGGHSVLVPGPNTRIIAVGHLGLRANGEATVDVAQVDGEKA
ncbi:hypothetical protein D3C77_665520 [compost metagenome]